MNDPSMENHYQQPFAEGRLVVCGSFRRGLFLRVLGQVILVIIFGSPDEMKLKSCATLFSYVSSAESAEALIGDHGMKGGK